MATEKTHLLQKSVIVNMPKQILLDEEVDNWRALKLEELMPFCDDPYWRYLRSACFLSFWTTIIVIFIAACVISILESNICHINPIINKPIVLASNTMINNFQNVITLNETVTLERMSIM